ncbi:MAG TPA: hypothetical protein PLP17_07920 [Oligoflexia bacterium]|mgnify:CR=1 FL=1|nr:hypothetical protein [Oligoflexia bacterium]
MTQQERFDLLLAVEDSGRRGRLKQAALALTQFRKVHTAPDFDEAYSKLCSVEPVDVMFIGFEFGWEAISAFITKAKELPDGDGMTFVLVMKSREENSENMASGIFSGIHGIIYEPYAADHLQVVAKVATKVKLQAAAKRERAAVQLLLLDAIKHLDALAYCAKRGKKLDPVYRKLNATCESLKRLGAEAIRIYYDLGLELFEAAKPLNQDAYSGVSARVRRIVEDKFFQTLESEYSEETHEVLG